MHIVRVYEQMLAANNKTDLLTE